MTTGNLLNHGDPSHGCLLQTGLEGNEGMKKEGERKGGRESSTLTKHT